MEQRTAEAETEVDEFQLIEQEVCLIKTHDGYFVSLPPTLTLDEAFLACLRNTLLAAADSDEVLDTQKSQIYKALDLIYSYLTSSGVYAPRTDPST
jgi:hypothetical protein